MLAALAYWMHASGIPFDLHLVAGFRPGSGTGIDVEDVQTESFQELLEALPSLCGIKCDADAMQGLFVRKQHGDRPAVEDSLMYG
jgi:hypothetical protein